MSRHKRHGKRDAYLDMLKSLHIPDTQDHRADFYRGCSGKVRHPSRKIATGVRRSMMNKASSYEDFLRAEGLEPYPCSKCGGWHLGHPTPHRAEAL